MKHRRFLLVFLCALLLIMVVPGVFAAWQYIVSTDMEPVHEDISALLNTWKYGYRITYIHKGEILATDEVWDNTVDIDPAKKYKDLGKQEPTQDGCKFSHWMNAGSTRVDKIPAGNTEDIVLYPSFENLYTAMFVDQEGNILGWDNFTKNSYNNIKTLGNSIVPPAIESCTFDYWEVHVTDSAGKTIKTAKLADYKFNDGTDVTIYPIYTYNGDVNLIPVDTDGDGITDEYHVGGYSNPNGQNLVVIPDKVNGIEITAINANAFSSYDGVHSVVIPNTIKTVGGNILAVDWRGWGDKGETVTIYFEGTYEQWLAKEASFPVGWDDGLSGDTRIFFLDENGKVDPSQDYMQAKLNTNLLGTGTSLDWNRATVTQALKTEYTGKCDCKTCKASNLDRPDKQYWEGVTIG